MGQFFTSIEDDSASFSQFESFWMYLSMKNCAAREWYIISVMKNLPSDKEEGMKSLPFPEGEW